MSGTELRAAIGSARAVVIPSEWYENAPISVMEASAMSRPIIGADIGGIPELIRQEETGFIFESGNVDSLVAVLERVQRLERCQAAPHRHGGPGVDALGVLADGLSG